MRKTVPQQQIISFQGELGAYSHQACVEKCPDMAPLPCHSFGEAIEAVNTGKAHFAMLPVENSTYGRVADIHRLLPDSGLHIVGEHFLRVHIALMAPKDVTLNRITKAVSHPVLLGQCHRFLSAHGIRPVTGVDTAGSAMQVAQHNDGQTAALASSLAAQIYDLTVLVDKIEDHAHNTTRFLLMSPNPAEVPQDHAEVVTSFVFRVRSIPAALYKALGGFATNGVNMVKLESYMVDGSFTATQFYADIIGHPDDKSVKNAFEELSFFADHVRILGSYPAAYNRIHPDESPKGATAP